MQGWSLVFPGPGSAWVPELVKTPGPIWKGEAASVFHPRGPSGLPDPEEPRRS